MTEWVDDGSLAVSGDGTLPFYLIDSHEESTAPGTVYLFGKVRLDTLGMQALPCEQLTA